MDLEVTSWCPAHVALGEGGQLWASARAGLKRFHVAAADLKECRCGGRQEPGAKPVVVAKCRKECGPASRPPLPRATAPTVPKPVCPRARSGPRRVRPARGAAGAGGDPGREGWGLCPQEVSTQPAATCRVTQSGVGGRQPGVDQRAGRCPETVWAKAEMLDRGTEGPRAGGPVRPEGSRAPGLGSHHPAQGQAGRAARSSRAHLYLTWACQHSDPHSALEAEGLGPQPALSTSDPGATGGCPGLPPGQRPESEIKVTAPGHLLFKGRTRVPHASGSGPGPPGKQELT